MTQTQAQTQARAQAQAERGALDTQTKANARQRPSQDNVLRLLGEVGMMAAGWGMQDKANAIFDAVAVLRPKSDVPHIGKALALASSGHLQECLSYLEKTVLPIHGKSEGVLCVYALGLALAGKRAQSQKIVDRILEEGQESWARGMAHALQEPQ
ncbi:MAG: hypothetical protein GDA54_03200 [Alphaproteobacteria bacterium GM7ARS4]|nr:hypothetical protein [Alphaproteobacteria bacterium GM7ARS4]